MHVSFYNKESVTLKFNFQSTRWWEYMSLNKFRLSVYIISKPILLPNIYINLLSFFHTYQWHFVSQAICYTFIIYTSFYIICLLIFTHVLLALSFSPLKSKVLSYNICSTYNFLLLYIIVIIYNICPKKVPQETHFHLYNLYIYMSRSIWILKATHYKIMRGCVLPLWPTKISLLLT